MEKRAAWNKGKIIGQKVPLKPQEIWSIRTRLEIAKNTKELALRILFYLNTDSGDCEHQFFSALGSAPV